VNIEEVFLMRLKVKNAKKVKTLAKYILPLMATYGFHLNHGLLWMLQSKHHNGMVLAESMNSNIFRGKI
jgi:hypothetical protein